MSRGVEYDPCDFEPDFTRPTKNVDEAPRGISKLIAATAAALETSVARPSHTTHSDVMRSLLYPDETRKQNEKGDAGARASLRRAETPVEALLFPACQGLLQRMVQNLSEGGVSPSRLLKKDERLRRVALIAALLCQRQTSDTGSRSFARAIGPKDGDTGIISAMRFQHLMAVMNRADEVEQLTALRRVVLQAKGIPFDIRGFIRDLLSFSEPVRIRWTFDYHNTDREDASDTAPSETVSSERLETQQ